jgi:hypothetical protein
VIFTLESNKESGAETKVKNETGGPDPITATGQAGKIYDEN